MDNDYWIMQNDSSYESLAYKLTKTSALLQHL